MKFRRIAAAAAAAAMAASIVAGAAFSANAEELFVERSAAVGEELTFAVGATPAVEEFHPLITGFSTADKGVRIAWEKTEGAAEYRLYVREGEGWKGLISTDKTFYYHRNLKNNTEYTYTLRAFDADGREIGTLFDEGFKYTYLDAPVLVSAKCVYGGMKVSWKKVEGAVLYKVYRKSGSAWNVIGATNSTDFIDALAPSGGVSSYTVRCFDAAGKVKTSYYDSKGVSGLYVASPEITKIQNSKNGAQIFWNKVNGAAKYRVFVKNGSGWTSLGITDGSSFIHTAAASGKEYTYTVRATDAKENYVSGHDDGVSNRFYAAPVPVSAESVYGGVKFSWKSVAGAPGYRVYRKTKNSAWQVVQGFTTALSYVDKSASPSVSYSYTVRVFAEDQSKALGSYDQKGKTAVYYPAPEITRTDNYTKGARVYFNKVSGASKYRVYVRQSGKWVSIGTTSEDYVLNISVKSGVHYTYTVRALDAKGNFLGGYNPDGYTAAFYAPPVVASVSSAASGYTVKWKAVGDAPMYRVYRKTFGGKWTVAGDTASLSFNDTKADKSQLVSYTLRCISGDKKSLSGYLENEVYYHNGKLASGSYTVSGKKYVFSQGKLRQGFVKIDGKTYYYDSNGNLQKDVVVGNKTDGYYYAGKNGVITYKFNGIAKNSSGYWYCKNSKVDFTYRNAVTYGGSDWIVLEGKATKVKTDADRTLFRAFKELAKCTTAGMSKYEKLKAAFTYVQGAYTEKNPRIPHYHGDDWVILYANDMFVDRAGNCFSYAAAFAYMAKAIGYTNVYACNSSGHGWAEINGKIYDPEWGRHNSDKSYFGLDYDTCTSPAYKTAISAGYSWMHVKV